ncbi:MULTISPECIES: DUF3135 domain-containing protein [unclassified Photobacterium]|uniref:DUF3135 domain-containing protein n=2 Tax=Photobacterium TaxID=657 RepID=UPI001E51B904|nr:MULTISPECIES: DUF3135 domain-containing protein [unclassified Photobacterium]
MHKVVTLSPTNLTSKTPYPLSFHILKVVVRMELTMDTLPNFDDMAKMAKEDPEQFEQLRQQLIEDAINQAHDSMQPRLKAQQSHIDLIISRGKNPLHTTMLLRNELQRQLVRFAETLQHPYNQENAEITPISSHPKQSENTEKNSF